MNQTSTPRRILRGAWPLWILAAFFAVIFTANIALVYMANTSWTGLSTEDAYEKGRLYNQKIATGDRQRQLGWQGRAQLQGGRLELVLTTKTGTLLRGAKVEVLMRRPIHEGFDFSLTMAEAADGTYFTNLEVPLPGLWEADFNALSGADKFRLKQRFTVK